MTAVAFPNIRPSGRSYNPGGYPRAEFQSLNGAVTRLQYGNRRFDAELQLQFDNISDTETVQILQHYEAVDPTDDWVSFTTSSGASGAQASLANYFREVGGSGLRWRYAEPPSVTSTFLNASSVSCRFVGQLDGA
jgi:hypothetical protein